MPPPRRQSSAPKTESKAGLVVALIFFILMTIVLGVVAYMGFDGQKELEGKAAEAKKAEEKERAAANDAGAKWLAAKIMMGREAAPQGADALGALNSNAAFRAELAEINRFFAALSVGWDPKTDVPPESLFVVMKKLQAQTQTADANALAAFRERDQTKADYLAKEGTAEAGRTQALTESKKSADTAAAAQKLTQEAKTYQNNEITKLTGLSRDEQTKHADAIADALTKNKRLTEETTGKDQTIGKLKAAQDTERVRIQLTDKVHGTVSKVDSTNGLAFINLGSADFVRPGMTFSVLMDYDKSQIGIDSELPKKATLEVTLVLGQKQSQARIRYSEGISSIAYPVEVGNKLFKPGWKPGSPVRWALAGHFDLNGLGRDETELLRKQLAKQGIVVDAYLDLNTLKVVGELNYGIDYLVIGTRPTGETARVIGDERKTAIENAINEMVAKAQTMGISVMQHRVFLPIAGFDLPRVQAFAQFPGGAAAPMGEEKKPMEEKKDEGK